MTELRCPRCSDTWTVSADDPDATIGEIYNHLRRHHQLADAQALTALGHVQEA